MVKVWVGATPGIYEGAMSAPSFLPCSMTLDISWHVDGTPLLPPFLNKSDAVCSYIELGATTMASFTCL